MKAISTRKKTLDPKTGESRVVEDKNPKTRQVKSNRMSRSEQDRYLKKIERDIINADYDISEFLKDHYKWTDNPTVIRNQSDVATYMYCMKMDMACLEPIAKGFDRNSIAESIGMSIGMRIASKDYREYKKTLKAEKKYAKSQSGITGKVRKGAANLSDTLIDKVDDFAEDLGFDNPKAITQALGKFSSWLRNEKKAKEAHGGVMPITKESAAITYIGLTKKAYQDMREPGADVDAVYEKYEKARMCLYEQARYNGVTKDMINQSVRETIGKMAERYPDMTIFEQVDKGDVEYKNGRFVSKTTGKEFEGEFNPRKPGTKADYKEKLGRAFSEMYEEWENVRDISNIDFQKNGFAETMDQLRSQYCSDQGENKKNLVEVSTEFDELYTRVAMDELNNWASKDPNRRKELDAYFEYLKQDHTQPQQETKEKPQRTASQMVSPELLEVAGMNDQTERGYGLER